jgi:hypothetical protein
MDLDLLFDDSNDAGVLVTASGGVQTVDGDAPVKMTAVQALKCIDDNWYKKIAGKKARWMDLIGDYAGNERFILMVSHCCNRSSAILYWRLHALAIQAFRHCMRSTHWSDS